jgi:FkbM family methyltransferase
MLGRFKWPVVHAFHYVFPRIAHQRHMRHTNSLEIEIALLPLLADPERESIDVGANVGLYADRLAALTKHVHIFEAHPRLAYILKAARAKNATVYHGAVSSLDGFATLNIPLQNGQECDGLSTLERGDTQQKYKSIRIRSLMLDSLSQRNIGFVKIDVEGHELEALAGSDRLISKQRPTFLIEAEERHRPGATKLVFDFFAKRDYRGVFVFGRQVIPVERFDPTMQDARNLRSDVARSSIIYPNNFIFIPKERFKDDTHRRLEALLRAAASEP